MVALGGYYEADPNNIAGEYVPVPPGEYRVHVKASERKEARKPGNFYYQLDIEVLDGDQAGRVIIERLNLENDSAEAVRIAQGTLNAICFATGKVGISDTAELHNIPMIAKVKVEEPRAYVKNGVEYPGSPQNKIASYKPVTAAPAAPAQTGGAAPASLPWKRAAAA